MTNPTNKKTHEQFITEIPKELDIDIIGNYVNTDTKIEYKCQHGINKIYPWALLTRKYCCRKGYYDSGNMWESNTWTLDELKTRVLKDRKNVDVSECKIDTTDYKKIINIKCKIHNVYYESRIQTKMGLCPECDKERTLKQLEKAQKMAWSSNTVGSFVSKNETKWLDGLQVKSRQYWLKDVKYKVDGYDPITKTVYLYHGRFWHGCPETYDPETIHPIIKLPMKDLYEKTMHYENKIKAAGYNLIVKWGT
jgi:hypothetical protein